MFSADSDGFVRNFILPQPDLYGFCDNMKSAEFLRGVDPDSKGSCVQQISDLETASETILNPLFYERAYFTAASTASAKKTIQTGFVFIEQPDGRVEQQSSLSAATYNSNTCSVENYVREVLYRVFYQVAEDGGHYIIDNISADFYLVKEL